MRVTAADIAAVRTEEGGLTAFIAALTADQPAARAPHPPTVGARHGPTHRPGAWPAGTRTDRDTCDPGCTCSLTADSPPAASPFEPARRNM